MAVYNAQDNAVTEHNPKEHWQRIVALSQTMLEAAHAQDWIGLIEMEAQRSLMLGQVFDYPWAADERPWVMANIRRLLETNQQIIDLSEGQQRGCAAELHHFNMGRRAQQSYGENQ
ncbi:MAG TPA: flagellar protein FliT [Gammaproteobacteria bacterium]|nr:flagellar protein FliT [Gammaproteobacteria bacterium]